MPKGKSYGKKMKGGTGKGRKKGK